MGESGRNRGREGGLKAYLPKINLMPDELEQCFPSLPAQKTHMGSLLTIQVPSAFPRTLNLVCLTPYVLQALWKILTVTQV